MVQFWMPTQFFHVQVTAAANWCTISRLHRSQAPALRDLWTTSAQISISAGVADVAARKQRRCGQPLNFLLSSIAWWPLNPTIEWVFPGCCWVKREDEKIQKMPIFTSEKNPNATGSRELNISNVKSTESTRNAYAKAKQTALLRLRVRAFLKCLHIGRRSARSFASWMTVVFWNYWFLRTKLIKLLKLLHLSCIHILQLWVSFQSTSVVKRIRLLFQVSRNKSLQTLIRNKKSYKTLVESCQRENNWDLVLRMYFFNMQSISNNFLHIFTWT